jgi:hypothetical protein
MDTETRDRFITEKLNEGLSLSEVQKLLGSELGIRLTYLELRLLAADLAVDWERQDPPAPDPDSETVEAVLDDEPEGGDGTTRVTISKLVRPGASLSGDVTFASGARAEWYVDPYGRLGLNPEEGSGRPTQDDLREFQEELQRQLGGM